MKINLSSSMADRRASAAGEINSHFSSISATEAHRDQAHRWKRGVALLVMDGATLPVDDPFAVEAQLRGLPTSELARDIISKPDNFAKRELRRQKLLLAVSAATTPAAIDAALAQLN